MTALQLLAVMYARAQTLPAPRRAYLLEAVRWGAQHVLDSVMHHPGTERKGHPMSECVKRACTLNPDHMSLATMAAGLPPGTMFDGVCAKCGCPIRWVPGVITPPEGSHPPPGPRVCRTCRVGHILGKTPTPA